MDQFWMWFIRPIAEMLGVVALIVVVLGLCILWALFDDFQRKRKNKKELAAKKAKVAKMIEDNKAYNEAR